MKPEVHIAQNDEDLQGIFRLRYDILRKPWQQSFESSYDDLEKTSVNAFIAENKNVIACGRLQDNGNGVGQVRYMAVAEDARGRGLGKAVLQFLEAQAKTMGMKNIELHARENALEFYLSQGYELKEKTHNLWSVIQHYRMLKHL
jgi:N-acetylglutamate synthase-like GNAT family acetyltransferase